MYHLILWAALCPIVPFNQVDGVNLTRISTVTEYFTDSTDMKVIYGIDSKNWSESKTLHECSETHIAVFAHPKRVTEVNEYWKSACCQGEICSCLEQVKTEKVVYEVPKGSIWE